MCWNAPVSIISAAIGYAVALFLLSKGKQAEKEPESTWYRPAAKWHAMFVANIACVEMTEFFLWFVVADWDEGQEKGFMCPLSNHIGTHFVYLFGYANWMWVTPVWAYFSSNDGQDKGRFELWVVLGVLTFVAFIAAIFFGSLRTDPIVWGGDPSEWEYHDKHLVTCTFSRSHSKQDEADGDLISTPGFSRPHETQHYPWLHNHLYWRFHMFQQPWLPNPYAWFVVGLTPLLFYKPVHLAATCFFWGAVTFIVPYLIMPTPQAFSVY